MRRQHPAWRLLAAEHAPLIGSFLHRAFIAPNVRVMAQSDLAEALAHASQWGEEPQPLLRDLPRLTEEERALFDELRDNRLALRLRLEQERIGFGWLQQALAELPAPAVLPDPVACHAAPEAPALDSDPGASMSCGSSRKDAL